MRFMTQIIAVLLYLGTPVFAASPATPGKDVVEQGATQEGGANEAPDSETKKFVITKGEKLFRYVKFRERKEQGAIFSVIIAKSVPAEQNALYQMLNHGPCPGSFTMGADNEGAFRFVCRNNFHGYGQLVLDPTTQRITGRGMINERDEFEFRE